MVCDAWIRRHTDSASPFRRERSLNADVHHLELHSKRVVVIKPLTFMNHSGSSVRSLLRLYAKEMTFRDLLVVVDDVSLDLGRIRARPKGSSGGHNGLKSIEKSLGTNDYGRLRVGVDPPPSSDQMVDHVLGRFKPSEADRLDKAVWTASQMIDEWVRSGDYNAVMRVFQDESRR